MHHGRGRLSDYVRPHGVKQLGIGCNYSVSHIRTADKRPYSIDRIGIVSTLTDDVA
jgi:hypothetical protein